MPHYLIIDLGREVPVSGLTYLPRQDGPEGRCLDCEVYAGNDPTSWGEAALSFQGQNNNRWQALPLQKTIRARYLKLVVKSAVNDRAYASVAELDIITP